MLYVFLLPFCAPVSDFFYRTDATAGFTNKAKEAATDLIWPLFANEVTTVGAWVANLEK